jgi:anti-sigma regulatory factor (Ser/Thr protein kinase)
MDMTVPICVAAQQLRTLRVRLPAQPTSAAAARRHVKAAIDAWDLDVDAYVATLLASELITNALTHGLREDETFQLVITSAEDWMRVSVHDSSRSAPVLVHTPLDAEDGRGLTLLASLSASWGFQQTATGKAVYFTLTTEADGQRPT